MKKLISLLLFFGIISCATNNWGQDIQDIKKEIENYLQGKNAVVGVAVSGMDESDTFSIYGRNKLPMMSVFKFPLAMAVLHQVNEGNLSLNQIISISAQVMPLNTYSPMRDKFPNGVKINIAELIHYAVAESDNIATDVLIDLIGGTTAIEDYLFSIGMKGIAIKCNEAELHEDEKNLYRNWIQPIASNKLLQIFFENNYEELSASSYQFLLNTMISTNTSSNRLKAGIGKNAKLAHKTGSSGKNEKGISIATNDVGIVCLPNGSYYFISIFVCNSSASDVENEAIISFISKKVWEYFFNKSH